MSLSSDRPLAEIKRETEQSRAALTSTVQELKSKVTDTADEWRQRVSPDAIKSDVRNYITTRTNDLRSNIIQSAKDNPLQALAIVTGIAMPALKLARSIPTPILLLGAGLFLSNTKKGQELSAQAQEAMSDMASSANRKIHDLQDGMAQTVNSGVEAVEAAKSTIAANAEALASQAIGMKDSAVSAVQDLGSRAASSVKIESPDLPSQEETARSFSDVIQTNPLLVAGIGLVIGGFIANVLPKSDAEQNVFGSASAKLKDQAQDAIIGAVDTARNAAVEAFDDISGRAAEHGLSPQGLSDVTKDIGDRVRKVADAASDAALVTKNSSTTKQEMPQ